MSTILDRITSAEDQSLDYIKQAQEQVLDVVKRGVELADRYVPEEKPELAFLNNVPKPAELIDSQFAFARKLLDNQRDFAKAVVTAVSPLLPAELVVKKPVKKAPASTTAAA